MTDILEEARRLRREGDLVGAEAAFRAGDDDGDGSCASELGTILANRGEIDAAEAAFRRSDERGDAWGSYNLGILLESRRGDVAGAIEAWTRADEQGHAMAAFNLGCSFREMGDLEGAEQAWRRGSERGDGGAAFNLGLLLDQRGDLEGAEAAWRRGSELGDSQSDSSLGRRLEKCGDVVGAEDAFRRSDERGDPDGAFNLGALLSTQDDPDGALAAMQRAADRGHPGAPQILKLLQDQALVDSIHRAIEATDRLQSALVLEKKALRVAWDATLRGVPEEADAKNKLEVIEATKKECTRRVAELERRHPWMQFRSTSAKTYDNLVSRDGSKWVIRADFTGSFNRALQRTSQAAQAADQSIFTRGSHRQTANAALAELCAHLSTLYAAASQLDKELKQSVGVRQSRRAATPAMVRAAEGRIASLADDLVEAQGSLPATLRPWSDGSWESWSPSVEQSLVLAGQLRPLHDPSLGDLGDFGTEVTIPLNLSLMESLHLVCNAQTRVPSQGLARSLMLRTLAAMRPGTLQLSVFDPTGLGQSVGPFLELAEYDRQLLGGQVWTSKADLQRVLAEHASHIELVIQRYLRSQYGSIDEFNAEAGEIAEPYRLLCVFDFPEGFDEVTFAELRRIVENGRRCGVATLLLSNEDVGDPYGVDRGALSDSLREVRIQAPFRHSVEGDDLLFAFEPESDEDASAATRASIIDQVGRNAQTGAAEAVDFERAFSLFNEAALAGRKRGLPRLGDRVDPNAPETWWPLDTTQSIAAPIGLTGARDVAVLTLDSSDHAGALLVGRPGSGKSTLLHTYIAGITTLYGPEELELHLIDFKEGVEFKVYAAQGLPHARSVAVESDREFGLSVLESLSAELSWRGSLLRESPETHASFDALRSQTTTRLPRIVLIFDEFQVLFSRNDKLGANAADLLELLIRQGRGLGIHVLLGSQSLSGVDALGSHVPQLLPVRILLAASESDQFRVLGEGNTEGAQLSKSGEGILNSAGGAAGANERFRGALIDPDARASRLKDLRQRADASGFLRCPIVFEGNAPVQAEATPVERFVDEVRGAPTGVLRLRTGTPMAISGTADLDLRREAGANVLLVARDENAADGAGAAGFSLPRAVATNVILSAVARRARVNVVDFTPIDDGLEQGLAPLLDAGAISIDRRRRVPAVLGEVRDQVARRIESDDVAAPSTLLVLFGLHRARDFDTQALDFDDEADLHGTLSEILKDGPEVGVHTLLWFETVGGIARRVRHDAVRECSWRLAGKMSADDSQSLLGADAASSLRPQQLIAGNEDLGLLRRSTGLTAPGENWVRELLTSLQTTQDGNQA